MARAMILDRPPTLLRIEGFMAAVVALAVYARMDASWWLFVILVLVPDVSMLGYLGGERAGAALYNAAHTTILPLLLLSVGVLIERDSLIALNLIWLTHIA